MDSEREQPVRGVRLQEINASQYDWRSPSGHCIKWDILIYHVASWNDEQEVKTTALQSCNQVSYFIYQVTFQECIIILIPQAKRKVVFKSSSIFIEVTFTSKS